MRRFSTIFVIALVVSVNAFAGEYSASLKKGDIELKSIGPISFGPEQILFVSDPKATSVYAIHLDVKSAKSDKRFDISGLDTKIASMLGVAQSNVIINDLALDAESGRAYLSVTRGRGPDAIPLLVSATADGKVGVVDLEGVAFAKSELWALPGKDRRGRDQQMDAITEIAFADDHVIVAGLSNEEFSSRLRVIPFPFSDTHRESGLEIYHTAHGQWETHSPIRTFTTFTLQDELQLLAAHTCTPLVTVPIKRITSDQPKVVGNTIAELGNRNRPLDMLVYTQEGDDYLLITNSTRGVMKLAMNAMPGQEKLVERISGVGGVPADTIESFAGALQVEPWGDKDAVVLRKNEDKSYDLTTLPLP
jgi:hypothetical protein